MLRSESQEPGGGLIRQDIEYALCQCTGKTVGVSLPYRVGEPVFWTTTKFDVLGRVKKVISPDGASASNFTEYRNAARQSADNPSVYYQAQIEFDAAGIGKAFLYDIAGALREVREDFSATNLSYSQVTTQAKYCFSIRK